MGYLFSLEVLKNWQKVGKRTRFKKGFSGDEINYPGSFDMVFDKNKYAIYKILRKIRRIF